MISFFGRMGARRCHNVNFSCHCTAWRSISLSIWPLFLNLYAGWSCFSRLAWARGCTLVIRVCEAWHLWRNIGDSLRNQVILCALNSDVYCYTTTTPKVYHVMDTWQIVGPAPIICNAMHPTIPHGALPWMQAHRQRDYPEANEDSKAGEGDGSPQ